MEKINIKKIVYKIRNRYLQLDSIVITVALVIAASWTWNAIGVMQRNYTNQRLLDAKLQQKQLLELQNDTLVYQSKYYQSREYLELQARDVLGLAAPGEHVLILPPNSKAAQNADKLAAKRVPQSKIASPSNTEQWLNFILGGTSKSLQ